MLEKISTIENALFERVIDFTISLSEQPKKIII